MAVKETSIPELELVARGKVRDIYDMGENLLIVTTDRMSAFDVVMAEPIDDKGKVLNLIAAFWFDKFKDLVPNHLISTNPDDLPANLRKHADMLRDRMMLVKKTKPLEIECIVRGYLSGSGWKDYGNTGKLCGIELPTGMVESAKFDEPIFTPSTKAELGQHDENISFEQAKEIVGADLAEQARDLSLKIYSQGRDYAAGKGIIIADTKFEFGVVDGELILIDEVMTPDSSRFWPADQYQPGRSQPSYDKQYLRDYLNTLTWDKTPPPPALPSEVIEMTRSKYVEALEKLTGIKL